MLKVSHIVLAVFMGLLRFSLGQQIEIKIKDQKDTTAFMVNYFGKGTYYADTAMFKKGKIRFDMTDHNPGMFGLYIPGRPVLDFLYNGQSFSIETDLSEVLNETKFKNSKDNQVYYHYLSELQRLKSMADSSNQEDAQKFHDCFKGYCDSLIKANQDLFVSKVLTMYTDVKIPDSLEQIPVEEMPAMDRFSYYRDHYWDRVDFNDDRLVRTKGFHPLLEYYFSNSMMIQHWDTVCNYAIKLCDQLPKGSETFQYCVSWITSHYEKSEIMGMDKVFVTMAEHYYCNSTDQEETFAFWMTQSEKDKNRLSELCEKVAVQRNLVLGVRPPNIILPDSTDQQWIDFYSLTNDYTVLYFWDPECGHCKKMTPALQHLYSSKLKSNGVEIFAVGKAVGEDFLKWKEFIRSNHLEFINVAVTDQLYKQALENARSIVPRYTTLESLNYHQTYDIYSTPKIWVLDKEKKIIAKGLSIEQLDSFFDQVFTNQ
ncbi:MAG: DUF5106 domain-containing protein [Bacteroidetes bacterium]|nr:MAG: DUF5106 domain-containing protein [Bacteroidota bacterium]